MYTYVIIYHIDVGDLVVAVHFSTNFLYKMTLCNPPTSVPVLNRELKGSSLRTSFDATLVSSWPVTNIVCTISQATWIPVNVKLIVTCTMF